MKKTTLTFLFMLAIISGATAQQQYYDTTFGNNGILTENPDFQGSTLKVLEHEGAIYALMSDVFIGLTMRKYSPEGVEDTSFNLQLSGESYYWSVSDAFQAFAEITPGNKLLMAIQGISPTGLDADLFNLSRYNLDGSVDTTYGVNGRVQLPHNEGEYVFLLGANSLPNQDLLTVCFNGNAVVVHKFDANGTRYTNLWNNGQISYSYILDENRPAQSVYSPQENCIYVGFVNTDSQYNMTATLVKLDLATGQPDTNFGIGGTLLLDNADILQRFTVDAEGKLLVSATNADGNVLHKFNSNGTPVQSFGTNGVTPFLESNIRVRKITAEADGGITVLGERAFDSGVAIFKLNADASPKADFGENGKITHEQEAFEAMYWAFDYIENEDFIIIGGSYKHDTNELEPSLIKLFVNPLPVSGATDFKAQAITLYPNPSAGPVHIEAKAGFIRAEAYTVTGQRAGSYTIINNTVNVAGLTAGTYVLKLYDDAGNVCIKKLVKL